MLYIIITFHLWLRFNNLDETLSLQARHNKCNCVKWQEFRIISSDNNVQKVQDVLKTHSILPTWTQYTDNTFNSTCTQSWVYTFTCTLYTWYIWRKELVTVMIFIIGAHSQCEKCRLSGWLISYIHITYQHSLT